jgi:hypothetical protein
MVPVELIMIGVFGAVFSVIFIFLHIELSTRKRSLIRDVETSIKDLPSKLTERSEKEDPDAEAVHEYFHSKGTEEDFKSLELRLSYDKSVKEQARNLMKRLPTLKKLSIGELERVHTMIEEYGSHYPEKFSVNRVLTRVHDILEPFVTTGQNSEGAGTPSGKSAGTGGGESPSNTSGWDPGKLKSSAKKFAEAIVKVLRKLREYLREKLKNYRKSKIPAGKPRWATLGEEKRT